MTRMTIDEIHAVNLQILTHIKSFCAAHHIKWWLSDGTLLGAVRHQGFIPWDDDADIMMARDDYDRFIKEYRDSHKFRLYCPERKNSYLNYARLCEMEDTFFGQKNPWTKESPGIGVDIFPLDGCPSADVEFTAFATPIVENRLELLRWRALTKSRGFRKDVWGFCKDVVHFIAWSIRRIAKVRMIRHCLHNDSIMRRQYDLPSNRFCTFILGCSNPKIKKWEKSWFREVLMRNFEGVEMPIPIGYDARLHAEYGDYMTPPPENERCGHDGVQVMYWRG